MSMQLVGPYLTTTGKVKGKQKFRSSAHAYKVRENKESWDKLLNKYEVKPPAKRATPKEVYVPPPSHRRDTGPRHPSRDTGTGIATKAPDKVYTGNAMIGIGQLHKSNAIPVFKQEDAADIAKMRRG